MLIQKDGGTGPCDVLATCSPPDSYQDQNVVLTPIRQLAEKMSGHSLKGSFWM